MRTKLLSIALVLSATFGSNAQVGNYNVGDVVSDFTVTDVHGVTHVLSDYTNAGKWVFLDFFFVTCGPCQATVPFFSEFHEKYGCNAGDIVMISIDSGDDDAAVLSFETTYSMSTGFNPAPAASGTEGGGNAVVADFGIVAYPTYCIIGADMKLKNGDVWPVSSMADFETALTAVGLTPTEMACAANVEENLASLNNVSLYPNPATTSANISVNLEETSEVTVNVYNMVGAVVLSETFNGSNGANMFTLNTNSLDNGQYIVNISLGENVATTQVSLNVLK
ncbi:MAG: redoxin domain-containing protein [Crocinitomicaceae bacterium]|nr:redoxin domain-containing protein [Crocinitomicaceae bacterium]|tara:strand:- start:4362 stop:5201 length:840 start_codon:yes stop_codon:yes gene_type:complete